MFCMNREAIKRLLKSNIIIDLAYYDGTSILSIIPPSKNYIASSAIATTTDIYVHVLEVDDQKVYTTRWKRRMKTE